MLWKRAIPNPSFIQIYTKKNKTFPHDIRCFDTKALKADWDCGLGWIWDIFLYIGKGLVLYLHILWFIGWLDCYEAFKTWIKRILKETRETFSNTWRNKKAWLGNDIIYQKHCKLRIVNEKIYFCQQAMQEAFCIHVLIFLFHVFDFCFCLANFFALLWGFYWFLSFVGHKFAVLRVIYLHTTICTVETNCCCFDQKTSLR